MSNALGSATAFVAALALVLIWAASGPLFGFSNTWQLVINTGTTIMTFLMVFLIQNTQNRDSKALHLKIDELLRTGKGSDAFIDIEDMTDDEIEVVSDEFRKIHEQTEIAAFKKLHSKLQEAHHRRKKAR